MAKGQSYEREFCTALSLWWTNGDRTDVFWRTSGSGARACVRGQRGKKTYGQHGDVCATDPIGDPLIKVLSIECKRGYHKHTFADLLDRPPKAATQQYEKWFTKAHESARLSGSLGWMLVVRRDRRRALVFLPTYLANDLGIKNDCGALPMGSFNLPIKLTNGKKKSLSVEVTTLDIFFKIVSPQHVQSLVQR